MKTAVIYARYSSNSQTEQSIEGQIRVCNEYAKANNIFIVDTYIDRAMTGKNNKRPDFQRMLQDSKKKQWDYVLVYKLDRFSRNFFDTTICEHELNKNGVKLLSAMEKGIINQTTNNRIIELEKKVKELDDLIIIEESKKKQIFTREYLEKYYDDMLLDNPNLIINYLIKSIKLYDTKMEITFNSPANQSLEYQGFFFCEKNELMIIYKPSEKTYETIDMKIEMYI